MSLTGGNHDFIVYDSNRTDTELVVSGNIGGDGGLTKTEAGTLVLSGNNSYVGDTAINGGILQIGDGVNSSGTLGTGDTSIASGAQLHFNRTGTHEYDGLISGNGSVTQKGSGTIVFSGDNTYKGTTTVSAGTLLINGDQSNATGPVTVADGAALGGTGTVGGDTTIDGIHAPGGSNNAGTLTHLGNLTYNGGSKIEWELFGNTTASGSYDQIQFGNGTDTRTLNFAGATTFELNFNSVDWTNDFWNSWNSHQWLVYEGADQAVITNFNNLSLNAPSEWLDSGSNALGGRGNFFLYQSGNDIYLRYQAVPEPAGFTLLGLALGAVSLIARPRRRMAE